jgi:hypothetical protein
MYTIPTMIDSLGKSSSDKREVGTLAAAAIVTIEQIKIDKVRCALQVA